MSIEWNSLILGGNELKTVGLRTENARRANSARMRDTNSRGASVVCIWLALRRSTCHPDLAVSTSSAPCGSAPLSCTWCDVSLAASAGPAFRLLCHRLLTGGVDVESSASKNQYSTILVSPSPAGGYKVTVALLQGWMLSPKGASERSGDNNIVK